ncbi:Vesicle-associated membrane protein isoform 2 [Schistosoma japonicum]|uniref:Vesicle-associated membrane protein isoform 2 n=1 Tax=Schistosoma japonicum TaxID=6182 RepID=A0A4Z2CXX2_SCHJA|nr:Vesicle-associated membrane protein isoform 2 [Schistosoma japonicum]
MLVRYNDIGYWTLVRGSALLSKEQLKCWLVFCKMSIYYFAISNNESIVCHHAIANRSFENVVYDYLKRHPSDQVMRFNQGNVYFICVTVSEISFVAAADQSACKQSEDLVSEVSQHFLSDSIRLKTAKGGAKGCLQNSYGPVLEQFMELILPGVIVILGEDTDSLQSFLNTLSNNASISRVRFSPCEFKFYSRTCLDYRLALTITYFEGFITPSGSMSDPVSARI